MKKTVFLIGLGLFVFIFWKWQSASSLKTIAPHDQNSPESTSTSVKHSSAHRANQETTQIHQEEDDDEQNTPATGSFNLVNQPTTHPTLHQQKMEPHQAVGSTENLVTYTIDGGVAVTQGDMVLGEFQSGALLKTLSGQAREPEIKTWPTSEIPYFIQPNLPHPERVQAALQMFNRTNVRFIPYDNHSDAIVFERSTGTCKSYVGYIGGLQKIFLADACSAREIAHEIMHALGFIHEQNRIDRDASVRILWENISDLHKVNFEKFSSEAMKVSGLSKFDFESIMLYPDTMFSLNGQPTIKPLIDQQLIAPKPYLSAKDIERVNQVY